MPNNTPLTEVELINLHLQIKELLFVRKTLEEAHVNSLVSVMHSSESLEAKCIESIIILDAYLETLNNILNEQ